MFETSTTGTRGSRAFSCRRSWLLHCHCLYGTQESKHPSCYALPGRPTQACTVRFRSRQGGSAATLPKKLPGHPFLRAQSVLQSRYFDVSHRSVRQAVIHPLCTNYFKLSH